MRVQLRASPFTDPVRDDLLKVRVTVLQIIEKCPDMAWAKEFVRVRLNAIVIPPCWWPYVTVKPEAEGLLAITIVQQRGQILPILASVALIALTAGIGTFGAPFLGAAFAAGSAGAAALASGVGIVGQLGINALTAPPKPKRAGGEQRETTAAGINVNQMAPLELLPTLHGELVVSPSIISPWYVTFENGFKIVHANVGIQGPNTVEDIKINGVLASEMDDLSIEYREGTPADEPLTLARLTCIQVRENRLLKNFETVQLNSKSERLIDQDTPLNSYPSYYQGKTKGDADEIWLKFLAPSGMVKFSTGSPGAVPVRIEIRRVGDPDWIKLPTIHIWDENQASGPVECEAKIKFVDAIQSGRMVGDASGEWPIYFVDAQTARGQAFQYNADAYFIGASDLGILPDMTSGSQAGYVITASVGANPFRVADRDVDTTWVPGNNQLPAWVKFKMPVADTVKAYRIRPDTDGSPNSAMQTNGPTAWFWEWSDDDVNYILDHTVDVGLDPPVYFDGNMGNPGAHLYWRVTFTANNGAANEALQVAEITLFHDYALATTINDDNTFPGSPVSNSFTRNVSLTPDGVEFYMLKSEFPKGVYEWRVKRGLSYIGSGLLNTSDYEYGGNALAPNFFEHVTSGAGNEEVRIAQKVFRTDLYVEMVSTVSYDTPFDNSGITVIALEGKNLVIDTISAKMTSKARVLLPDGTWSDGEVATNNPAALYRRLIMGHAHPNPPYPELLNSAAIDAWYARCVASGYECNYLQQGGTIAEVKEVMAYTGWASPQESELIGVIEDYDRSPTGTDESVEQTLTPLNSRFISETMPMPDIEHAIIAEFQDEDDDYKIARPIIYREGYNALNAKVFTTIRYPGFTNLAKVTARATFDMLQSILRAATIQLEVDIEGFTMWRGMLVGHNDDIINRHEYYGLITAIETDGGGNVVSITVNNKIPFSTFVNDLDIMLEGIDPANPAGCAIRIANATSQIRTLSTLTDSETATFTTPFPLIGSGVAVGQMVVFGIAGKEYRRMIVMGSRPSGLDKRVLSLAPEAPELFAA